MTAVAFPSASTVRNLPPAITLAQLIRVLSELTEDEDEIVGTLLHMVEQRSVRLVAADNVAA